MYCPKPYGKKRKFKIKKCDIITVQRKVMVVNGVGGGGGATRSRRIVFVSAFVRLSKSGWAKTTTSANLKSRYCVDMQ